MRSDLAQILPASSSLKASGDILFRLLAVSIDQRQDQKIAIEVTAAADPMGHCPNFADRDEALAGVAPQAPMRRGKAMLGLARKRQASLGAACSQLVISVH